MTYRAILVGAGAQGKEWLRVLGAAPDWKVVACVEPEPSRLSGAVRTAGLPDSYGFVDLDSALGRIAADAVFIATPPWTHADLAVGALRGGYHVLLEKPLADSWADGVRLYHAARSSAQIGMVSQNRRFAAGTRTLREVVRSGRLGELNYAFVKFRASSNQVGNYRASMPHFTLVERGAHLYDQLRAILGREATRVLAKTWNPDWSWSAGDACALVHFELEGGSRATCYVDWIAHENESDYLGNWTIEGREASASLAGGRAWLSTGPGRTEEVPLLPTRATSQLALEESLAHFTRAIATGEPPETSLADNIRTLAMICGAVQSVERSREVELADLLREL